MNEILDVLKLLKQNYLMFIGAKSLNRLAMFISGYAYCIYRNEGKELCFLKNFKIIYKTNIIYKRVKIGQELLNSFLEQMKRLLIPFTDC